MDVYCSTTDVPGEVEAERYSVVPYIVKGRYSRRRCAPGIWNMYPARPRCTPVGEHFTLHDTHAAHLHDLSRLSAECV